MCGDCSSKNYRVPQSGLDRPVRVCDACYKDLTTVDWEQDNIATSCKACNQAFTVVVRKHHCRQCGGN